MYKKQIKTLYNLDLFSFVFWIIYGQNFLNGFKVWTQSKNMDLDHEFHIFGKSWKTMINYIGLRTFRFSLFVNVSKLLLQFIYLSNISPWFHFINVLMINGFMITKLLIHIIKNIRISFKEMSDVCSQNVLIFFEIWNFKN